MIDYSRKIGQCNESTVFGFALWSNWRPAFSQIKCHLILGSLQGDGAGGCARVSTLVLGRLVFSSFEKIGLK